MEKINTNDLLSKNREYLKVLEFLAEEEYVFHESSTFDIIAKEKSNNKCYINCFCYKGYSSEHQFAFTFVKENISFYI